MDRNRLIYFIFHIDHTITNFTKLYFPYILSSNCPTTTWRHVLKQNDILNDLQETHQQWKSGKRTLGWWRNETGYQQFNVRKFCKIPLSHPPGLILIDFLYLLQLDYVIRNTSCVPARKKAQLFRQEVSRTLRSKLKKKGIPLKTRMSVTTATT